MNTESQTQSQSNIIPALTACLPTSAGRARLIYDATLTRPLHVRDSAGVKLTPEIHQALAQPLGALAGFMDPLELTYLRADLNPRSQTTGGLDGRYVGCLPRLLYAHAAASDPLQEVELTLRLSLQTVPSKAKARNLDTRSTVQAGETALHEPAVGRAVRTYADFVARAWARCCATTLGPWVVSSGVRELRLAGSFVPNRRHQLAVLAGGDIGQAAQQ
jgi:hypothetical protein